MRGLTRTDGRHRRNAREAFHDALAAYAVALFDRERGKAPMRSTGRSAVIRGVVQCGCLFSYSALRCERSATGARFPEVPLTRHAKATWRRLLPGLVIDLLAQTRCCFSCTTRSLARTTLRLGLLAAPERRGRTWKRALAASEEPGSARPPFFKTQSVERTRTSTLLTPTSSSGRRTPRLRAAIRARRSHDTGAGCTGCRSGGEW